ncbi:MAG TPA: CHASE2 domain-containing protein [Candidatus Cybelea sp.]|nr:CHASE2 domain-containing protein [Candidatus Cybelea sp.]
MNLGRWPTFPGRLRGALDPSRAVATVILLAVIALRVWEPGFVEVAQLRGFDFLQQRFPRSEPAVRQVAIVDIDDASLAAHGQWPWPRSLLAELIAKLDGYNVKAIGFDMLFAEPDRLSPPRVAETISGLDSAARQALASQPDNDRLMADAIRQTRLALGQAAQSHAIDAPSLAPQPTPVIMRGTDARPFLFHLAALVRNVPVLESAAKGHGLFTILPELDGVVRRVPVALVVGGTTYPALVPEILRVAAGRSASVLQSDAGGVLSMRAGDTVIPTDERGRMWVRYAPHSPGLYVSAKDILNGTVPPQRLANRYVLIGTSAVGLLDTRSTPLDALIPGVEIHAQMLETILDGTYFQRPNWVVLPEVMLMVLLGVTMITLVPRAGAQRTFLILTMLAAIIGGGTIYAFVFNHFMLDGTMALATAGILYTVLAYMNYSREEAERRKIRGVFGRYLAPAVVEELTRHPEKATLGGEVRAMSYLFGDIRGFTAISEQLKSNPRALTRLVNRLMTPMTEAVLDHGGTVDKYIGDCIMAFWNAPFDDPRHETHACDAALTMLERLAELNAELRAEADTSGKAGVARVASSDEYRRAKEILETGGGDSFIEAAALLLSEAERGFAPAQYSLAKAYRDGIGVPRDPAAAVRWFRAAAEQGHGSAQERLGMRYARGEGVERDLGEAVVWLSLAARQGVVSADAALHELYGEMPAAAVAHAEARALALEPQIAERQVFQLEIGIGINSGECIVGNMGSMDRLTYTVLGDSVNLAARLQALTKDYGVPILIGESTASRIEGFALLELDLIAVRGRRAPSRVFGLLGGRGVLENAEFQALHERHGAMLAAYRRQEWARAFQLIAECRTLWRGLDELYDLYAARIEHLKSAPPGTAWRAAARSG